MAAPRAIRLRNKRNQGAYSNSIIAGQLGVLALIALLVVAAFGNTLGVYFHCDDYLHLPYLYRMFHGEPGLLAANFFGPWIGERSFYIFFRPLTEVSLVIDYFLYAATPFGYHLSNLIWHSANAFVFYLLAASLFKRTAIGGKRDCQIMAVCCALVFAAFPTHSEAVAWILARADLVGTFFFLLTLYFYTAFTGPLSKWLAPCAFILCLFSKEVAISLPPSIFALSILFNYLNAANYDSVEGTARAKGDSARIVIASIKQIVPYAAIFGVYLIWRYFALGTMLGGYVGSIGETLNENFMERWILSGSLWQLLHPFNECIFSEDHPLRLVIRGVYAMAGLMAMASALLDSQLKRKQKVILFAFAFLLITLIPNFQVWGMSQSMSGSRIAYLPSIPLSLLIVCSIYLIKPKYAGATVALKLFGIFVLAGLVITLAAISHGNNVAWLNSSQAIKTLKADVEEELSKMPAAQKLVLLNCPSRVDGAFTFTTRTMLGGLFQPPLTAVDLRSRIIPLDYHAFWSPYVSQFDYNIAKYDNVDFKVLAYDPALGHLRDPQLERISVTKTYSPLVIQQSVGKKSTSCYMTPAEQDGPLNPQGVSYIEIDATVTKKRSGAGDKTTLFFIWNNRPADQDDQSDPYGMSVKADGVRRKILIELVTQKRWLLSKDVSLLRLDLPTQDHEWQIHSAVPLNLAQGVALTPSIRPTNLNEDFCLADLSQDTRIEHPRKIEFIYDAKETKGAKSVIVEVSKAYASFEHYNFLMRDRKLAKRYKLHKTFDNLHGRVTVDTAGGDRMGAVYQVRVGALDDKGELVGTYSDPVVFKSLEPVSIN